MAKAGGKWMQGAVKHPGALSRAAKKAKMSPMAFARKHAHAPGKLGQRARFALIASRLSKRRKVKKLRRALRGA